MKRMLYLLFLFFAGLSSSFISAQSVVSRENYGNFLFSPRGDLIAFNNFYEEADLGRNMDLLIANIDGENIQLLIEGQNYYVYSWSPNGNLLLLLHRIGAQSDNLFEFVVSDLEGNILYTLPNWDRFPSMDFFQVWEENSQGFAYSPEYNISEGYVSYLFDFESNTTQQVGVGMTVAAWNKEQGTILVQEHEMWEDYTYTLLNQEGQILQVYPTINYPYPQCSLYAREGLVACVYSGEDSESQEVAVLSLESGEEIFSEWVGIPGYWRYSSPPVWSPSGTKLFIPTDMTCCWDEDNVNKTAVVDVRTEQAWIYTMQYAYAYSVQWHPLEEDLLSWNFTYDADGLVEGSAYTLFNLATEETSAFPLDN